MGTPVSKAKLIQLCAFLFLLGAPQLALANWERYESIEWKTQISDSIAIAKVSKVKSIPSRHKFFKSQLVSYVYELTMKGTPPKEMSLRQDYYHDTKEHETLPDRALKAGDRLVLFFREDKILSKKHKKKMPLEVIFWVNITKQGREIR